MIALRFGDQGRGLSVGDTLIQGHFNISSLIDYAEKDERENGENAKKTKKKKKSDAPKSADTSNVQVHMNSDLAIDVGDEIKAGIYILIVRSVEYKELNEKEIKKRKHLKGLELRGEPLKHFFSDGGREILFSVKYVYP